MKKILSILLNTFVLFSLISCVDSESSKQESKDSKFESISVSSVEGEKTSTSEIIISSPSISGVEAVYYHVTFVNYDDTVLYETDVLEGAEAIYRGEDPTKEEDDEFTYEFDGWDVDLSNITSDVTTVAKYKAKAKEGWGSIIWF